MDAEDLLKDAGVKRAARYLHEDETAIMTANRHWVSIAEPIVTPILALLVIAWFSAVADVGAEGGTLLFVLWLIVAGRTVWALIEWRRAWFISTDQRLFKLTGVFVTKVAMMPLNQVTDITYQRSIPGQILGYGTLVLETPGQDQAFSTIKPIPQPDAAYRAITRFMMRGRLPPITVEEVPTDERRPGTSSTTGPDTEPFVIPDDWKRTDGEARPGTSDAPRGTHRGKQRTPAVTSPISSVQERGHQEAITPGTGPLLDLQSNRRRLRKR